MALDLVRILSDCAVNTLTALSAIGMTEVRTDFSAQASDGNTNYNIELKSNRNGFTITASGDDFGFLEFGAGNRVDTDSFAADVPYAVRNGSYADVSHGMYKRTKYRFWKWGGKYYKGIPATHGMENAANEIENNAETIYEGELNKLI